MVQNLNQCKSMYAEVLSINSQKTDDQNRDSTTSFHRNSRILTECPNSNTGKYRLFSLKMIAFQMGYPKLAISMKRSCIIKIQNRLISILKFPTYLINLIHDRLVQAILKSPINIFQHFHFLACLDNFIGQLFNVQVQYISLH